MILPVVIPDRPGIEQAGADAVTGVRPARFGDSPTLTMADLQRVMRRLEPKVIEHSWIPEGDVILMNDLGLPTTHPADWDTMTAEAKLRWGVDQGMTVIVGRAPR